MDMHTPKMSTMSPSNLFTGKTMSTELNMRLIVISAIPIKFETDSDVYTAWAWAFSGKKNPTCPTDRPTIHFSESARP